MDDNAGDVVQHTRDIIWVRLKASILAAENGVEYDSGVNLWVWLYGSRGYPSSIWCPSLSDLREFEVIVPMKRY
jgi:hypothetical protein